MCCNDVVFLNPWNSVTPSRTWRGLLPCVCPTNIWAGGVTYSSHMRSLFCIMEPEQTDIRDRVTYVDDKTNPPHFTLVQCNHKRYSFLCRLNINHMTDVHNCAFILELLAQMWQVWIQGQIVGKTRRYMNQSSIRCPIRGPISDENSRHGICGPIFGKIGRTMSQWSVRYRDVWTNQSRDQHKDCSIIYCT